MNLRPQRREIIALWGAGTTYEEALTESLKHVQTRRDPYFAADKSFKIDVKRFGATLPREDLQAALDKLKPLALLGRVDLKSPDTVLSVHEYWGRYHHSAPKCVRASLRSPSLSPCMTILRCNSASC